MGNEEKQGVKEFFENCSDVKEGFIFAICTDKIICDHWPLKGTAESEYDENLVLEIRVFNEEKEHKLFRGDMSKEFGYRLKDDSDGENKLPEGVEDYYDELPYLDIDTTKKPEQDKAGLTKVRATGGGEYHVPIDAVVDALEYAVLKVRHYISKYPETGKAFVSDWRCIGIYKNEDKEEKCVRSWEGGE